MTGVVLITYVKTSNDGDDGETCQLNFLILPKAVEALLVNKF